MIKDGLLNKHVISTDFTKKICSLEVFSHQNTITTHIFNMVGHSIEVGYLNGNYHQTKLSTILNLAQLDDNCAAGAVATYTCSIHTLHHAIPKENLLPEY